ncbi:hypothetical protein PCANC_07455 [Puccinia coronata f. sp. avenae]|uniref:Uncharacterized protein n=1 Tax=Puccinia coronata f. sp. avenae TaxID=200324 RepID=A0A2N5T437_9BASI|nr:hypothetical protein PCANC_07455 [Puccinia coronata f. sp. avenae]
MGGDSVASSNVNRNTRQPAIFNLHNPHHLLNGNNHPESKSHQSCSPQSTLAILSINSVKSMHSQCHCCAHGGKLGAASGPLVAKMIPADKEKSLYRRLTPTQPGKEVAGVKSSACSKHGYNTKKNMEFAFGMESINGKTRPNRGSLQTYTQVGSTVGTRKIAVEKFLDGCKFENKLAEADGCSTIWLTKVLFRAFGRDEENGSMHIDNWDLNKEKGSN